MLALTLFSYSMGGKPYFHVCPLSGVSCNLLLSQDGPEMVDKFTDFIMAIHSQFSVLTRIKNGKRGKGRLSEVGKSLGNIIYSACEGLVEVFISWRIGLCIIHCCGS